MKESSSSSITIVIPGDDVTDQIIQKSKKPPKLGIGLRVVNNNNNTNSQQQQHDDDDEEENKNKKKYYYKIIVTCAGRLEYNKSNNTYYIKQNITRYRPSIEDRVIGIVEDRIGSDGNGGDIYKINIGGCYTGRLSNLSFEGATKRNKPNLKEGMLLYTRITSPPPSNNNANNNTKKSKTTKTTTIISLSINNINSSLYDTIDPILSCQLGPNDCSAGIQRKDWMTNEGTYGELKGGICYKISIGLARELLLPKNLVLYELSKQTTLYDTFAFEICVGVNGYLWIHSTQSEYTIMIYNAIINSQVLTEPQIRTMVKTLLSTVHKTMLLS